jgi:tripartite-type tricarboxylate transporter receptor subunit TctC
LSHPFAKPLNRQIKQETIKEKMMLKRIVATAFLTAALCSGAQAQGWQPNKPVEFVVTAGAGGGTDIFARTVQSIIQKHNLMAQPIVVNIKGGGSGAEGYVYTKLAEGDSHKLVFGTHNSYVLPLAAKVAFTHNDLTPLAAMVFDEFLLWVKADSPIKNAKDYIADAKAKDGKMKMAGAQSKDSDELVTKLIDKANGTKIIYVPFKSGGEADVQLSGGHVDSNVNNPSESTGSWKAGKVRPLCVMNREKLAAGPKITDTQSWSDIPTCKAEGLGVEQFQQPRLVMMPGKQPPEVVAFYTALLKKVAEQPEWKEYAERTGQTSRFLGGDDFKKFIGEDYARFQGVFAEQGWLVK